MIILHGNIPTQKTMLSNKKKYIVSGVGDLTFTGLVFSWFLPTGRRTDQGLELQLNAVQNCGQFIVQLRCEDYYTQVNPTNPCIPHMQ